LTDEDANRFAGVGIDNIADKLDLDKEDDFKLYRKVVEAKVKKYLDNPADFSIDEFPVLFISVVISRYYGMAFIKEEKDKKHKLDTVGSIIRFPKNMGPRKLPFLRQMPAQWERDEVFKKEELLFAFIREVKCKIHGAKGLRSIGIAVTDCPGLSASAYDSSIAMDVFSHSDAIWYLLGHQATGASELTDISHAFNAASGKMYATTNMKGQTRRHFEDVIMPDQKSSLEGRGINVELKPYHALLALLAVQGAKIIDGTLDKASIEEIIKDAKRRELISKDATAADVKDAWIKLANACLLDIKPMMRDFAELPEKLSEAGIAIVSRESCQNDTLAGIKQYAIENKADAILRANGVDRAIIALEEGIEKPLSIREKRATEEVEEAKLKNDKMKVNLAEFQNDAIDILEKLQNDAPDRMLAKDLLDKSVIPAIREVADSAAIRITSKMGLWTTVWNFFGKWLGGNDNQGNEIKKILSEEMKKAVTPKAVGWEKGLKSGKNQILKDSLLKTVDSVRKRLLDKWEKQIDLKTELPSPTGSYIDATTDVQSMHADLVELSAAGKLIGIGAFGIILASYSACGFIIGGPLGGLLGLVAGLVIGVLRDMFDSKEDLLLGMSDSIYEGLMNELSEGGRQRAGVIDKIAVECTSNIRKGYLKIFQIALEEQRTACDQRYNQTLADLKKNESERKRIAKECNHIRTQEVEPLRKKLQAFRDEILLLLK